MGSVAASSSAGFDLVCSFPSDLQFSLELQLDSIGVCSSSADSHVSKHMLDFPAGISLRQFSTLECYWRANLSLFDSYYNHVLRSCASIGGHAWPSCSPFDYYHNHVLRLRPRFRRFGKSLGTCMRSCDSSVKKKLHITFELRCWMVTTVTTVTGALRSLRSTLRSPSNFHPTPGPPACAPAPAANKFSGLSRTVNRNEQLKFNWWLFIFWGRSMA
jgi:hypothetical protein